MKINLINTSFENIKEDIHIIFLKNLKNLEKSDKKYLNDIGFEAKEAQSVFYKQRLFVGLNKLKEEDLKIACSVAINKLKQTKYKKILISLVSQEKELALEDLIEGLLLGEYAFLKYKKEKIKKKFDVFIDIKNSLIKEDDLKKILNSCSSICENVNMVRDIVNTTAEDFNPKTMSEVARNIARNSSLECKILGEDYLQKNNMNAMYAVGRASRHESQLIHLTYKPKEDKNSNSFSKKEKGVIVLVGKGLTYDSGGLSLKSSLGMINMKCDKAGGAAVLGIMKSLESLACDYEVHGIIGAVENMIGADAFKPGDILIAKNGTSIEVRNTDAEGRLVLADCLCYAQDELKNIDYIFDIATLTGSCITALGSYTTAVMGHNKNLKKKMQKASNQTGELIGVLPYNRYLFPIIKSNIADITNSTGSTGGGTILASMFLDKFIKNKNKNKWLHLDIAGSAFHEKSWAYNKAGASGSSVRLLLKFIKNLK